MGLSPLVLNSEITHYSQIVKGPCFSISASPLSALSQRNKSSIIVANEKCSPWETFEKVQFIFFA